MTSQPRPPSAGELLKEFADRLRNADRNSFNSFLQALDVYTIEALEAMMQAPQDKILEMQGRARQCKLFLDLMSTCHLKKTPPQAPTPGI